MRRRRRRAMRTAGTVLAGVVIGVIAGTRLVRPLRPQARLAVADRSSAEAALDRVLPEVDFDAVPFDEAVERVQQLGGVPLVVHWNTLAAAHLDTKTPVSYRARNVKLATLLLEMTHHVGTYTDYATYAPAGDVILISTPADLLVSTTSVRAYDVRDLVAQMNEDPWRGWDSRVMYQWAPTTLPSAPPPATEELFKLIEDTVAPDSWIDNGGTFRAIHFFAGRMIVTQTLENHRQIVDLLNMIRDPVPSAAPAPPLASGPDLMLWNAKWKTYVSTNDEVGESALRGRLAEVRLEAVPFEEAVTALADLSRANLVADWMAMEAAGANRRAPVTLHLRDVTLADALRALFEAGGAGRRLAFRPDGGYVTLTSREEVGKSVLTRAYDVRDLLSAAAGPPPAVGSAGHAAWRSAVETGAGQLIKVMQDAIDPDSWKDAGGVVGAIKELNGELVITQTWENHQSVARLLATLRADPAKPSTRQAGSPQASGASR